MLSAQCDGLRERAKVLRQGDWSDGAEDAKMMDDAADTILSLRDRAQDLQAENAKLRELVRDLWLTGCLCDAIPDMRLQANGGDWRTMQERVYEALGIEVDA